VYLHIVTSFVLVRQLFTVRRRIVSIHEFFVCNLVWLLYRKFVYTNLYLVFRYVVTFDSMILLTELFDLHIVCRYNFELTTFV